MVPPERFIPIAEDSGLILDIGEWVMRQVCRQMRDGQGGSRLSIPVTVNLSASQFRNRRLVELLLQLITENGIEPGSLEIEITESALMGKGETISGVLETLARQGLRLVIDDFGTGYSNLAYLKRFDIYKLKIDQSFISDIATDPNDAALARGIIGLAKSVGLKVVAEGVETQAQLDFLIANGCDEGQGFLLCAPVNYSELAHMVGQAEEWVARVAAK